VYAVLIAETGGIPGARIVFVAAAWIILISVYPHGLTAAPLSARYGTYMHRVGDRAEAEHKQVSHLPVRLPPHHRDPTAQPGPARDGHR
jgi:hypothetical protein